MKTYRVIWEIDVDAPNFVEAGKLAKKIQLDKNSRANVFYVKDLENVDDEDKPNLLSFYYVDLDEDVSLIKDIK